MKRIYLFTINGKIYSVEDYIKTMKLRIDPWDAIDIWDTGYIDYNEYEEGKIYIDGKWDERMEYWRNERGLLQFKYIFSIGEILKM